MKDELRTERLHIETDAIAINPFKAAFGNIELKHSVNAEVDITLTEADISRAFNSDFLRSKFVALQIQVDGKPTTITPEPVEFHLPGEDQAYIQAVVNVVSCNQQRQVAFTAVPTLSSDGNCIVPEQISYKNDVDTPNEVAAALVESASELLDLRNFKLEGMRLQLRDFEVLPGELHIQANATVDKFPGS